MLEPEWLTVVLYYATTPRVKDERQAVEVAEGMDELVVEVAGGMDEKVGEVTGGMDEMVI